MASRTKLKAGCGLTMVFAAGFLCGAIALFLVLVKIIPLSEGWRDEESKEFVLNHLANQLKLTDEQIDRIKPIVYEALEERYTHRKTYVEADIELTKGAFERIRPILDEKQQEKAKRLADKAIFVRKKLDTDTQYALNRRIRIVRDVKK